MVHLPGEMENRIGEILGGEWFNIYYVPDTDSLEINLDGEFTLLQLKELVSYLEENEPKLKQIR